MKHKKIYTKEECIELAKKYKNRSEFRIKNWVAYIQCFENNWLDEIMPNSLKRITYEECYNTAKMYNDYSTFRCNEPRIYNKVIHNGWIKDFLWLKRGNRDANANINCVYSFEFKKTNSVYVGRTMDKLRRYKSHLSDPKDSVFKYIKENKLDEKDFIFKIIVENITLYESAEKECEYIEFYKKNGWNLLNKVKGGSIGSPFIIWNYENTLNKAKQYEYLKDFAEENISAYNAARKNGWLKEYTWLEKFKTKNIYTYDECFEKAKECITHYQFYKKYPSYVSFSKRKNWYKDFVWLNNKKHDSIIEYDLQGNFIKKHKMFITNKNDAGISNCANGRIKQHKNSIWKYEDELFEKYGNVPLHINVDITPKNFKPIIQYDKDGNFIKEYKTIVETGYCSSSIFDCLNGKTIQSHGFIWRYKEDVLCEDGKIKNKINNIRNNKKVKCLIQYDKKGNFIREYETQTLAIQNGFKRTHIEWTANKRYKNNKDFFKYDFIWLLKNELFEKYEKVPSKIDFNKYMATL